jgi:hypothetical protein
VVDWTNHRCSSAWHVFDHTLYYKEVSKDMLLLLVGLIGEEFLGKQGNDRNKI